MRSTKEWIGKTDDQAVPGYVRVRNLLKFDSICQECGTKIVGKRWVTDHRKALINGGENRENNLGPIHESCDRKIKTPRDVAEKSKTYKTRKSHLGVRKPSRFPGARGSKFKKKINGTVERR